MTNRAAKHPVDLGREPIALARRERVHEAARRDPGAVQDFARVDVPDARNAPLIEQQVLDGAAATPEHDRQPGTIQPLDNRVHSKAGRAKPIVARVGWRQVE